MTANRVSGLLTCLLWLLIVAASLFAVVPITYDEAWNFLNVSTHSPRWVVTNYQFANNHLLFSLLQSVVLSDSLVELWPPVLRLVNLVVAAGFFYFGDKLLREQGVSGWLRLLLILGLVFCSPIVTTYFFVARGYLLGNTLLALSLIAATSQRVVGSAVLAALSVYCLPTYAFAIPGVVLGLLFQDGRGFAAGLKSAILFSVVFSSLVVAAYWPVRQEMAAHAGQFSAYRDLISALRDLALSSTNTGIPKVFGVLLLVSLGVSIGLRCCAKDTSPCIRMSLFSVNASLSQFILTLGGAGVGVFPFPFLRSIQPGILLLYVATTACAASLVSKSDKVSRVVFTMLVTLFSVNASVGIYRFTKAFVFGDPASYVHFDELNGTAVGRGAAAGLNYDGATLRASQAPEPVLELYRRHLHYELEIKRSWPAPAECIVGAIKPRDEMRVLYEKPSLRGEICF